VSSRPSTHVGLAIVRAVFEDGPSPIIRVLRMDDLFRHEQVLGVTSSPDEAAAIIATWLHSIIDRRRTDSDSPTEG
jgi:hypothetical protein